MVDNKVRYSPFDQMRGIGLIVIMLVHSGSFSFISHFGWISLESFFVLSGFLVSGLLFNEYKKTSRVRPGRFFLRRGVKIYPLFFLVLIIHLLYYWVIGKPREFEEIIPEVFFFQNYIPGVMVISWSLALEEHFYLLLLIMVYFSLRQQSVENKFIIRVSVYVVIICLLLRVSVAFSSPVFDPFTHFYPSHLRLDCLAFGVIISWCYHFRRDLFIRLVRSYQILFYVLIILFLLPVIYYPLEHPFNFTIGLSLVYLVFGMIICLLLVKRHQLVKNYRQGMVNKIGRGVAFLGRCSYAIYLVHFLVGPITSNFIRENFIPDLPLWGHALLYLSGGIFIGVILTVFIEFPLLKWRDQVFPQPGRMTSTPIIVKE